MYTTTLFLNDVLAEIKLSDPDAYLTTTYSGRGMFGAQCIGFVTSTPSLVVFAMTLVAARSYPTINSRELALDAREDNMGLNTIVYFPSFYLMNAAA